MLERWLGITLSSVICATLAMADAWAAQAPLPGTVLPGQIERQFEKLPEPRAKPAEIRVPDTRQKPPPNADAVRFVLNRLTIDGVTVYPADTVRAAYERFLGKEVTLAEIYRIADTLTTRYRNDGYILSQVIVPAQAVEGGAMRLQAIEGYVADVRVEAGSAELRERVSRYAEKIKATRPAYGCSA
jgi:hemolysin activation/secretion protein